MDAFGTAQPRTRIEDRRFLTGGGRYLDDTVPPGALFGYVLRSPMAHGTLAPLDVTEAEAMPGIRMVLTAARLAEMGVTDGLGTMKLRNRDGSAMVPPRRPLLAEDRVRFVGEAVAFVVAKTLTAAKDAAEAIELDIEERPAHLALAPGGDALHDHAPDNVAFDWGKGDEAATEAAFAAAARTVALEVPDNRIICASMEPRGAWAEWDGARLHVCHSGQGVWETKADLARLLSLPEDAVRVTTPDVGGGFGMKTMSYPEEMLVAVAARALGRPVRWHGERTESMLSDNAGRDLISTAEFAFDADHRLTAYRVR
ncbi:MAG: xanthine dehydrogenase family protein molybdopterin-binding subunit, partial [Shimia sp.]